MESNRNWTLNEKNKGKLTLRIITNDLIAINELKYEKQKPWTTHMIQYTTCKSLSTKTIG